MRRRLVLAFAIGLSVAMLVAGVLFASMTPALLGGEAGGFMVFVGAIGALALTSIAIGSLLRLRVPTNPIGTVLILGALAIQGVFVAWPLSVAGAMLNWPATGALELIGWYATVALAPALYLLFPVVGILFPDGRLPGPRWRLPFALVTAALVVGEVMWAFAPWRLTPDQPVPNPFGLPFVPPEFAEIGGGVASAALFAGFALAVTGIIVRFRRAGDVERAQIKWLVAALSLIAVLFPLGFANAVGPSDLIDLASVLVGCLTPIAIGIAILRYRLYDIDRIISRTLSWAIITGGLLVVFVGLVFGLQALLADHFQGGGTVAVAVSTLIAFALFQPLRRRVQQAVDRRFDRARVDGERLAEVFATRLSTEVDLDRLAAELRTTARQAVRPASASIWLAQPERTMSGVTLTRLVGVALLVALAAAGASIAAFDLSSLITFLAYAMVGTYLVVRRPRNAVGWLLILIGWLGIATSTAFTVDEVAAMGAGTAPFESRLRFWASALGGGAAFVAYAALAFVFPSGVLPPDRRGRRIAAGLAIAAVITVAPGFLTSILWYTMADGSAVLLPNPFVIASVLDPIAGLVPSIVTLVPLGMLGVAVVDTLRRYRRADEITRLQLRWLMAAVAFVVLSVAFGLVVFAIAGPDQSLGWLFAQLSFPLVPIAVGAAVLRYRLFEIDRIVSRTIGWVVVTVVLGAVFAAGIVGLSTALQTFVNGDTLAVAASTLLAAVLFQPLRRRVQHAVDRRFDRARVDGEHIAEAVRGQPAQRGRPAAAGRSPHRHRRGRGATDPGPRLAACLRGRRDRDELRRDRMTRNDSRTTTQRRWEPDDDPHPSVPPPARPFRQPGLGRARRGTRPPRPPPTAFADRASIAVDIPDHDPLLAYLQSAPGPVDVARLELRSPAVDALRAAGVALVVPLVSQGELIGTLNLGPRLSEQDYSTDDRRLLTTLAAQAAPAIRVAQLVREQAEEAAERERLAQELRVATLIQQQFLPRELPRLPQWQVAAFYGPARAVGGDFYDFVEMSDGRIGIAVGDVTDKGVPAALVMARTHSVLRAEASRLLSPGEILSRANDLLCPEMPANMFVTCLFAILDPTTGRIVLANAGHNLPFIRTGDEVTELRATGMPLGLMPGIVYEEVEGVIAPDSNVLLYSDGLIEAHDSRREMFGFDRLREALRVDDAGSELLDRLLELLKAFTGPDHEQEDDITLVTLRRSAGVAEGDGTGSVVLTSFTLPGLQGNEREAMDRVAAAVADLGLPTDRLERLKTAVSETAMNAIEYGSQGREDVPIRRRRRREPGRDRRPGDRPCPVRRGPDGHRGPRPRAQARRRAEAARLGAVPHRAHGRRHGGVDRPRRGDPDRHAADGPRGDQSWMTDALMPGSSTPATTCSSGCRATSTAGPRPSWARRTARSRHWAPTG